MESAMLAGVLVHPVAISVLLAIVFGGIFIYSAAFAPAALSKLRLLLGLGGVVLATLVALALSAYASPEEAQRFGVVEANRWPTIWREFVTLAVPFSYVGLIGASVVGIPLALYMSSKGWATIPLFVAASLPISLAFVVALLLLVGAAQPRLREAALLIAFHAWLSFGFAFSARLPWRWSAGAHAA